jgi:tetratricopeptide (TPR) repeat protein
MRDPGPSDPGDAERLLLQGDIAAVLQRASAALANGAREPAWQRLQGLALAAMGHAADARGYLSSYARLCPGDADAWVNLGTACLDCDAPDDALDAFIRAGGMGAGGVPYLLGRGLALLATGRFADADAWLAQAQQEDPLAADVRLARGQCLAELERHEELGDCVAGVAAGGLAFEQRTVLAWLLAQAGRDEAAEALCRQLLVEQPAAQTPRVQLALLLERLNRVPEAAELLSGLHAPHETAGSMAALAIGRVSRRVGKPQHAIEVLAPAIEREADPAMAAQLWFERAKCHDLLQQADAAMHALGVAHHEAGTALRQRHPGLEGPQVLGWLRQRLRRLLPASTVARDPDPPDPVFLVGFPRSGTTLLEQMLANHSRLQVLDERPALESAIAEMRALPCWQDDDLDASLATLDASQCDRLRAHYRAEVARHLAPGGRLVDKYPLYLTRVGHIQRLFPDSDWVLLLRHPCDCVLSCHMQAFGLNGGALAFASLESTARTYAAVMAYWEEQRLLANPRVHTLRYEDLATRPECTLEQLMAFLSFPLEPAQLEFPDAVASRSRRINTPSYAQVAEPVHSRAVGRWRLYRTHFSPAVLDVLAPFVERYGYALD